MATYSTSRRSNGRSGNWKIRKQKKEEEKWQLDERQRIECVNQLNIY